MTAPKRDTKPIVIDETAGKKAYCQCGHSETMPHCDGAHSRLSIDRAPIVCDVPEDGKRAVCQCDRSANLPWCDGSHKSIPSD